MSEHLFSIVTVTLNNAGGLRRTQASLETQTCRDFEWIVVDGGSTDETRAFLAGCPQARWISEPDDGIYDAMNKGLALARGEYVVFLNAGDTLACPETLAQTGTAIRNQAQPPDLVYGDSEEVMPDGKVVRKPARGPEAIWYGNLTHHQSTVYRREAIASRGYDLRFRIGADYALTARVIRNGGAVLRLAVPICRFAPAGLSSTAWVQGLREMGRVRREILGMSRASSAAVGMMHLSVHALKRVSPAGYTRLRFRPVKPDQ